MRNLLWTGACLFPALLSFFIHTGVAEAQEIPEDRLLLLSGSARYEVVRGREFTVQVFLDGTVPEDVTMELPELPDSISIETVPLLISRADNVVEAQIEIVAEEAGRFAIDPILFKTTTGPWYVPRLLVEAAPSPGDPVPFGARWRPLRSPIYAGQSVPVVLEITGIDSFTYPGSISVRAPQSGLFEEVTGIGSVVSETVAGVELFEIPVAVFLLTTTAPGRVTIPSAQVDALGIRSTAAAFDIDVRNLPAVVGDTGAVGQFSIDIDFDHTTVVSGQSVELLIRIDGAGNLPVLNFPDVSVDGLLLVDQSEASELTPDTDTLLGYRGRRDQVIRLEPEEGRERATITVESFVYYNPEFQRVVTTSSREYQLEIATEAGAAEPDRVVPEIALLSIEELQQLRWFRLLELEWPLFSFLLGPALFAVIRLSSVRRKGRRGTQTAVGIIASVLLFTSSGIFPVLNVDRLSRAEQLVANGRHDVAGVLYELELQDHPSHAGLHYNRGVLALRSENAFAAVFHLRRAARLVPEHAGFREALQSATDYFDAPDQINVPYSIRPDLFFLLLFVAWTAVWAVLLAKPALPRSITLATLLMVMVLVAGGSLWSIQVASREEGIVRREVTVRRIPDNSADPWVRLDPVTTVQIELSYEEFYLVQTGSGVTGWVPRDDIRSFGASR